MSLELIPINVTKITIKYIDNCFEIDEDCMIFELKIPNINSESEKTISFNGWCLDYLEKNREYTCVVIESSKTLLMLHGNDKYYEIYLTYSEYQETLKLNKILDIKCRNKPNSDSKYTVDNFLQCIKTSYQDPFDNELIWHKLYSDLHDSKYR
jgi:hypothetical protein